MTRKPKKAKPRKPSELKIGPELTVFAEGVPGECAAIITSAPASPFKEGTLYPNEVRRLAAWLLKFAEWAESK